MSELPVVDSADSAPANPSDVLAALSDTDREQYELTGELPAGDTSEETAASLDKSSSNTGSSEAPRRSTGAIESRVGKLGTRGICVSPYAATALTVAQPRGEFGAFWASRVSLRPDLMV